MHLHNELLIYIYYDGREESCLFYQVSKDNIVQSFLYERAKFTTVVFTKENSLHSSPRELTFEAVYGSRLQMEEK